MQTHLQQAAFNYETHKHCKHWKRRTTAQYFKIKCLPGKPSSSKPSWGINSWLHQHGVGRKGDTNTIELRAKKIAHHFLSFQAGYYFSAACVLIGSATLSLIDLHR